MENRFRVQFTKGQPSRHELVKIKMKTVLRAHIGTPTSALIPVFANAGGRTKIAINTSVTQWRRVITLESSNTSKGMKYQLKSFNEE